ncbi:hypothetical protein WISP_33005 [Willisornis vidua]|uniref:Uncharacterized protein n=1 Tax=Willisornis vidua TaxID=1566151 RepID=A0ABQ9DQJ7_9PASS|nr:hypothetical protein WISP_33005 [Willisornis vidua]
MTVSYQERIKEVMQVNGKLEIAFSDRESSEDRTSQTSPNGVWCVVVDMLGDEEEEDDRDEKVIMMPSTWLSRDGKI